MSSWQQPVWAWVVSHRQRRAWLAALLLVALAHLAVWEGLRGQTPLISAPVGAATPASVELRPWVAAAPPVPAPNPAPTQATTAAPPKQGRPFPAEPPTTPAPVANRPPPVPAAAALPVYATQIPPAAAFSYELVRGNEQGTALLTWRPAETGFEARLDRWLPGRALVSWASQGGFDAAGLAPVRQTDQLKGRAQRAINFQREAGKISFSSSSLELPLPAGAQDRISWLMQLSAIVAARPEAFTPGQALQLPVSAQQGRVEIWTFMVQGAEALELPAGTVESAVFLQRPPMGLYEPGIEVWLDPKRHFLPVRLRWSRAGSEQSLEMRLQKELSAP